MPCQTNLPEKLAKSIRYEQICTENGQLAHVATLDPAHIKLKLVKAVGNPSLQKVSQLAHTNNALIAINGGFFHADGKAVGALKIDGTWISKPAKNRGLVGWGEDNKLIFDRTSSTFPDNPWWEKIDNVVGGAPLLIRDGEKISVKEEKTLDNFLTNQYARTAICVDKNNKIKLIVINGGDRKTYGLGLKSGMSIDEFSDFLLSLGCENALNLDGGYSSTFVKKDLVVNAYALSFLPERAVADALLVIPNDSSLRTK